MGNPAPWQYRLQEAAQENDAQPIQVHARHGHPRADSGQGSSEVELRPESTERDRAEPTDQADQMRSVADAPLVKFADYKTYQQPEKQHDGAMTGEAQVD